jgi:SAM-dependent methyltransferase
MDLDYDANLRLDVIKQLAAPDARIFEVGAGDGSFVQTLRHRGFDAVGVDLVTDSGPHVERGDERSFQSECDVVVSYYVLEHVRDAASWLRNVVRHLRPGGTLLIEVPDFERFPKESLFPEHLRHFAPRHLRKLFEAAGITPTETLRERCSRYFGFVQLGERRLDSHQPQKSVAPAEVEPSAQCYARGIEAREAEDHRALDLARELSRLAAASRPIVLWAANDIAGSIGRALAQLGVRDVRLVDSSPQKHGHRLPGMNTLIESPAAMESSRSSVFVVCSPAWNAAIVDRIREATGGTATIIDGAARIRQ